MRALSGARMPFFAAAAALPSAFVLLALATTWLAYGQGLDAPLLFDEGPNLAPLARLRGWTDAIVFVFGGEAGPLGRPLALATFLPEAWAWPTHPEVFRRTNVLIHLLNGLLLFRVALVLTSWSHPNATRSARAWSAALAAAFWLLSPLLVSSSLLIIQRMTILAATIQLLGLILYLHGRTLLPAARRRGFALMVGGLLLGTVLGAFAKENAVLLPIYALAIELFLSPPRLQRRDALWTKLVLWTPALAVIGALLLQLDGFAVTYAAREFTLAERLFTEARVLLQYLHLGLFPRASRLTPFRDDFPISHGLFSPPSTALAILAWAVLLALAVALRKRLPTLGFAASWFLGGHLLESTVVPLEIYFDHRNYLPLFGPIFFLATLPLYTGGRARKLVFAGLASLLALHAALTWQVTTLWGSPSVAARLWSLEHPRSVRATQFLSMQLSKEGDRMGAYSVLERAARRMPEETILHLQTLLTACVAIEDRETLAALYRRALRAARRGRHGYAIPDTVRKLFALADSRRCHDALDERSLSALIDTLLENQRIWRYKATAAALLNIKAERRLRKKDVREAVSLLTLSYETHPNAEVGTLVGVLLGTSGEPDAAAAWLRRVERDAPKLPFRAWVWRRKIAEARSILASVHAPQR